jgi:hypothetical protein
MKKLLAVLLGLMIVMMGAAVFAYVADPNDPAVLHIGNPPNSGTYLYGNEVQPISNTSLGILNNGNGQPTLNSPLLLILGVANQTSSTFVAPSITLSSGTGVVGGANVYGGTWGVSTGYAGYFTAASPANDVYQFIGLNPYGNASNNFGNWAAADLAVNGIQATGFGIFVYSLQNTGITGGTTVDVTFSNPIPNGTFAVAYGQALKGNNIMSWTTPFTESGLTKQVPEPGALLLLGSGILGLGLFGRKKLLK